MYVCGAEQNKQTNTHTQKILGEDEKSILGSVGCREVGSWKGGLSWKCGSSYGEVGGSGMAFYAAFSTNVHIAQSSVVSGARTRVGSVCFANKGKCISNGVRMPAFDVCTAVEVLGGARGGYSLLPAQLEQPAHVPDALKTVPESVALASLQYGIMEALVNAVLPIGFNNVYLNECQAVLDANGQFEVRMVPFLDPAADTFALATTKWAVVSVKVLIQERNKAPCSSPQILEELRRRAQRAMKASGLQAMHDELYHSFSIPLQIATLKRQIDEQKIHALQVEPLSPTTWLKLTTWEGRISIRIQSIPQGGGLEYCFGGVDSHGGFVDPQNLDIFTVLDDAINRFSTEALKKISDLAANYACLKTGCEGDTSVSLWITLVGERWARLYLDRLTGKLRVQLSVSARPCFPAGCAELESLFESLEPAQISLALQKLRCAALVHAATIDGPTGAATIVKAPLFASRALKDLGVTPSEGTFLQFAEAQNVFVYVNPVGVENMWWSMIAFVVETPTAAPKATRLEAADSLSSLSSPSSESSSKRRRTQQEQLDWTVEALSFLRTHLFSTVRNHARKLILLTQLENWSVEITGSSNDSVIMCKAPPKLFPVEEVDPTFLIQLSPDKWNAVLRSPVPLRKLYAWGNQERCPAHILGAILDAKTTSSFRLPEGDDEPLWKWGNGPLRDGCVSDFIVDVAQLGALINMAAEFQAFLENPACEGFLQAHCTHYGARLTLQGLYVWFWVGTAPLVLLLKAEGRLRSGGGCSLDYKCTILDDGIPSEGRAISMSPLLEPFMATKLSGHGIMASLARVLEMCPVIRALDAALRQLENKDLVNVVPHDVNTLVIRCGSLFSLKGWLCRGLSFLVFFFFLCFLNLPPPPPPPVIAIPNTHLVGFVDAFVTHASLTRTSEALRPQGPKSALADWMRFFEAFAGGAARRPCKRNACSLTVSKSHEILKMRGCFIWTDDMEGFAPHLLKYFALLKTWLGARDVMLADKLLQFKVTSPIIVDMDTALAMNACVRLTLEAAAMKMVPHLQVQYPGAGLTTEQCRALMALLGDGGPNPNILESWLNLLACRTTDILFLLLQCLSYAPLGVNILMTMPPLPIGGGGGGGGSAHSFPETGKACIKWDSVDRQLFCVIQVKQVMVPLRIGGVPVAASLWTPPPYEKLFDPLRRLFPASTLVHVLQQLMSKQ